MPAEEARHMWKIARILAEGIGLFLLLTAVEWIASTQTSFPFRTRMAIVAIYLAVRLVLFMRRRRAGLGPVARQRSA